MGQRLARLLAAALLAPAAAPAAGGELAARAAAAGVQVPAPDRPAVPCPAQTDATMVALLLGQSNAANHGAARSAARPEAVALFDGVCHPAADPLPGASGDGGSLWPALADALVEAGAFDRVVLVPAAVNGAQAARWAAGGDLAPWLDAAALSAAARYRITHVFWIHGETDLLLGTTEAAYRAGFRSVLDRLRALGIDAPVHMTVTSGFCGRPVLGLPAPPGNPVVQAQRALIAEGRGVCGGPDTDALLADPADRHDGCHLSADGVRKLAAAWAPLLADRGRCPPPGASPLR